MKIAILTVLAERRARGWSNYPTTAEKKTSACLSPLHPAFHFRLFEIKRHQSFLYD
jgi:hypothetical protein